MIQTLFILNSSGNVVIKKDYRGRASRAIVDFFWNEVCRAPSRVDVSPVLVSPRNYLIHILRDGLYYLAPVAGETSPLLIIELLHRIADTFSLYFGAPLNEGKLRKNFSLVFQLLEEVRASLFLSLSFRPPPFRLDKVSSIPPPPPPLLL